MPRFFFQVYNSDGEPSIDRRGLELSDLDTARSEAIRTIRELARSGGGAEDERYLAVDVVDEIGNTVIRARLTETVDTIMPVRPPMRPMGRAAIRLVASSFSQAAH